MKTLKIVGIIIAILIVVPLVVGFFASSKVHVERSKVIQAPAEVLFNEVNTLKNWEKWSPWHKIDHEMKIVYQGPESGKGAGYTWKSDNGQVGNGKLIIAESVPYDSILVQMDFMENSKGSANYYFEKVSEGVQVTWTMDSDMGSNPFNKLMGLFMDKFLGPMFEQGLTDLERVSKESASKSGMSGALKIETKTLGQSYAVSMRTSCLPADASRKLGESYVQLLMFIEKNNLKQVGPVMAIYHSYTTEKVDMEPAIPVSQLPAKTAGEVKAISLESTNVVVASHHGPYESTSKTHETINKWIKENNKSIKGAPWEVYVTDPATEKDTSRWLTKVYYPIL